MEDKDTGFEEIKREISKESAELQIETFMDYYGLDKTDYEPVDNADNLVQISLNALVRAIMSAQLVITIDDGVLSMRHILKMPLGDLTEITYKDRVGQANRAIESIKADKTDTRKDTFMAVLSSTSASLMLKLKGYDRMLYGKIATVFSLV